MLKTTESQREALLSMLIAGDISTNVTTPIVAEVIYDVEALIAENKRLVEALEEYADESNWSVAKPHISPYKDWWDKEEGPGYELARRALAERSK